MYFFIFILIFLSLINCINTFHIKPKIIKSKTQLKASLHGIELGLLTLGEGWHNYHHSYPKDYRASQPFKFNITTGFINLTKKLGLSYDHYINEDKRIPRENRFDKERYTNV